MTAAADSTAKAANDNGCAVGVLLAAAEAECVQWEGAKPLFLVAGGGLTHVAKVADIAAGRFLRIMGPKSDT